jgi:hypothetical protein
MLVLIIDSDKPKHWFRIAHLERNFETCEQCGNHARIVVWNQCPASEWQALVDCNCGHEAYMKAAPNLIL